VAALNALELEVSLIDRGQNQPFRNIPATDRINRYRELPERALRSSDFFHSNNGAPLPHWAEQHWVVAGAFADRPTFCFGRLRPRLRLAATSTQSLLGGGGARHCPPATPSGATAGA